MHHKPKTTRATILPPLMRRGYQVLWGDWAFLGAVRRPDRILESYCSTKKSAKGICQLQDNKLAAQAAALQEMLQATAHTLRPIAASFQAGSTIHDLAQNVLQELKQPSQLSDDYLLELIGKISLLAQYSITATTDATDCLARLNAEATMCGWTPPVYLKT